MVNLVTLIPEVNVAVQIPDDRSVGRKVWHRFRMEEIMLRRVERDVDSGISLSAHISGGIARRVDEMIAFDVANVGADAFDAAVFHDNLKNIHIFREGFLLFWIYGRRFAAHSNVCPQN